MPDKGDRVGILSRDALIGLNAYWRLRLFFYSGNNVEYICCHADYEAQTSDNNWAIWKITYDGNDISSVEGPLTGICDNREDLDWR